MSFAIDVLTVTRRPTPPRAIQSVQQQTYRGEVRHYVLVDGSEGCAAAWSAASIHCHVVVDRRKAGDLDGPVRLATLREASLRLGDAEYIAFLDDDNSWAPSHLNSLAELICGDLAAVHSERLLFNEDGSPYLEPELPWGRDRERRQQEWQDYLALGIVARGSNRLRDRVGMPHTTVDLGEWLLPRSFAFGGFKAEPTQAAWNSVRVEDHSLASQVVAKSFEVRCTRKPTLNYYLGGYSNRYDEGATIHWQSPQ